MIYIDLWNCNLMEIVWLVWSKTTYIFYYSVFVLWDSSQCLFCLAILNISPLNPKKSSDFFSLFVDFTIYIVKSTDFFNICEPNIIQIVYFLVLEDSGGLYLFGIWLIHELCSSSSWFVSVSTYISHCTIVCQFSLYVRSVLEFWIFW